MQLKDDRFTAHEREMIDLIPLLAAALKKVIDDPECDRILAAQKVREASGAWMELAWSLRGEKSC